MFKFLRKYNKWILVVGGILLVITFLIPEAIQSIGQQSSINTVTMATVGDGERISAVKWQQYVGEHKQIESATDPFGFGKIESPGHWYLLVREAQQAGLVGPYATDVTDDTVLSTQDVGRKAMLTLNAHFEGVRRLIVIYQNALQLVSDRQVRAAAARLFHTANMQTVVIKADADAIASDPTEEVLLAHFEKYKDAELAPDGTGFSYRLPNRVKLEWLEVPAASVEAIVRTGEAFSGVAQRMHWKLDPTQEFPPFDANAAVPEIVKDDLLKKLTTEKMEEISRFASNELRMSHRGLPELDGYVTLPENWATRRLPFQTIAEKIQAEFKVELPSYHGGGDTWMGPVELAKLPGIGLASTDKFGTRTDLSSLASFAREFGGASKVAIQKDVAGPPIRNPDGSLYFFRILDTDAARAPHDLNEVREKLVTDVKRLEHFEQLKAQKDEILHKARTEGLLRIALEYGTVVELQRPIYLGSANNLDQLKRFNMEVKLNPSVIPQIGADKSVVESFIDFALALPQDKPLADVPEGDRMTIAASDKNLALVLGLVNQQVPLNDETFVKLADSRYAQRFAGLEDEARRLALRAAFSLEALSARHNFVLEKREEADDAALQAAATN